MKAIRSSFDLSIGDNNLLVLYPDYQSSSHNISNRHEDEQQLVHILNFVRKNLKAIDVDTT